MKTLTLASLLSVFTAALAATPAAAQAQQVSAAGGAVAVPAAPAEPETVFSRPGPSRTEVTGWFVAPTFGTTGFGDTLAVNPGLRGGIYLDRRLAVGVTVNGLASRQSTFNDDEVRNVGTYGGLLLQYIVRSDRLLHVSFESTLGSGRWCNRVADGAGGDADGCDGKDFLVFEPVANLELNVARHVRIDTGVGYRFAVAEDGAGPSSRQMSGLVARTALVFGSF